MWRNTPYLSVFSPNVGKYKPEKLRKRTLFTQCKFNSFSVLINRYTLFFISNTSVSNARLKLAKNQANAKQYPETELLLFENYSHSQSTLLSKDNGTYSKK